MRGWAGERQHSCPQPWMALPSLQPWVAAPSTLSTWGSEARQAPPAPRSGVWPAELSSRVPVSKLQLSFLRKVPEGQVELTVDFPKPQTV